jgi:hypothetical protein
MDKVNQPIATVDPISSITGMCSGHSLNAVRVDPATVVPPLAALLEYLKSPRYQIQGLPPPLVDPSMYLESALWYAEGFNYDMIYSHFSTGFSPKVADSIIKHVKSYEELPRDPDWACISNARCFLLPSNTEPYDRWGGMFWNEGEMEILRLYHVDESGFCNYLTHYGKGKHSTPEGKKYRQSAIGWQVNDFESLWPLCVGAQHLTWTTLVREEASPPLERQTRAKSREK